MALSRLLTLAAFIALGLLAGLFGTGGLLDRFVGENADARGRPEGTAEPAALVAASHGRTDTIRESVEAVGTLRAAQSIDVTALSEGRVVEVAYTPGERVEEGDLLFRLDDRAERASLKEAEATLEEARSNFARAEELIERDVSSRAAFEAARAVMLRAEAGAARAANQLDDRRVVAPFAGLAGLTDIDPGERVDTSTVMTTLDDLSEVEIAFSLPERYFARVEPGQTVRARGAVSDSRVFEGTVSAIAPRVDDASRAFEVRATIPNRDRVLAQGMFMTATLVLEERRGLTVPEEAIISEGEATYLFVVDGGTAERREIRVGARREGRVEVLDGLEGDDVRVVTSGYDALEDGDAVRLREAANPSPGSRPDAEARRG